MEKFSQVVKIEVPGNPIPWKAHAGFGRRSFNPLYKEREYVQWEIKKQYHGEILKGAISLKLIYFMPIPKSISEKKRKKLLNSPHLKKPDASNMTKFYEDCLKKIVFEDDSLVYHVEASKYYSENPRTEITITQTFTPV